MIMVVVVWSVSLWVYKAGDSDTEPEQADDTSIREPTQMDNGGSNPNKRLRTRVSSPYIRQDKSQWNPVCVLAWSVQE